MLNFIFTITAVILILLFGFLNSVWAGFSYFALSFFVLICLYWLWVLIYSYIHNYHKNLDERFKLYCATLINNSNLSVEQINANLNFYFKKFKKTLLKEKIFEVCKMLVVLTILISCISLFFSGKLF